jgi:hypothetical protein
MLGVFYIVFYTYSSSSLRSLTALVADDLTQFLRRGVQGDAHEAVADFITPSTLFITWLHAQGDSELNNLTDRFPDEKTSKLLPRQQVSQNGQQDYVGSGETTRLALKDGFHHVHVREGDGETVSNSEPSRLVLNPPIDAIEILPHPLRL